MEWLVDGNNLMGSRPDGWWRDRRRAASQLVIALGRYRSRTGDAITVVFDGPEDEETLAAGAPVQVSVRFAPGGPNAADDEIFRTVCDQTEAMGRSCVPPALTVVTSDAVLAARVRGAGASVMGSGRFRSAIEQEPEKG